MAGRGRDQLAACMLHQLCPGPSSPSDSTGCLQVHRAEPWDALKHLDGERLWPNESNVESRGDFQGRWKSTTETSY